MVLGQHRDVDDGHVARPRSHGRHKPSSRGTTHDGTCQRRAAASDREYRANKSRFARVMPLTSSLPFRMSLSPAAATSRLVRRRRDIERLNLLLFGHLLLTAYRPLPYFSIPSTKHNGGYRGYRLRPLDVGCVARWSSG